MVSITVPVVPPADSPDGFLGIEPGEGADVALAGSAATTLPATEGADANAQVFQVRDGILAQRQSFYLDNQAEREPAEVAEEFIGQYYSASPAMPRTIVVGAYLLLPAAAPRPRRSH